MLHAASIQHRTPAKDGPTGRPSGPSFRLVSSKEIIITRLQSGFSSRLSQLGGSSPTAQSSFSLPQISTLVFAKLGGTSKRTPSLLPHALVYFKPQFESQPALFSHLVELSIGSANRPANGLPKSVGGRTAAHLDFHITCAHRF